jgi:site-specific DNA-methyltransferase (adenine-specific)
MRAPGDPASHGLLLAALRSGALVPHHAYSRAELVAALSATGALAPAAAAAADLVRLLAQGDESARPALCVEATGERRGRRYRLSLPLVEPASGPAAAAAPPSAAGAPEPRPSPCPAAPLVTLLEGDNLPILRGLPSQSFELIYIDPPFNTGKQQALHRIKVHRDDDAGDRRGFQGKGYRTERVGSLAYADTFDDYLGFLEPRLREAHRLLTPDGSLFFHVDYREVHYCKVLLDGIFGRDSFVNEIIWAYDYGARSKRRWPTKHDNILWYAKTPDQYLFDFDAIDRIPYLAPSLVGAEKAARGKTPTDVWWHTIVPTQGSERTGYPTQKPLGVLRRIVQVHSRPGDRVLDFFAGSGTTAEAAASLGRRSTVIDHHPDAIAIMRARLASYLRPPAASVPPDPPVAAPLAFEPLEPTSPPAAAPPAVARPRKLRSADSVPPMQGVLFQDATQ